MASKRPAPKGLAADGRRLWRSVADKYDLRPDELVTLEDVCAKTDRLKSLQVLWDEAGNPETTKGSMGQLVEHPIPAKIEKLRMERNSLLARLKLPDEPSGGAAVNQNRAAGQSRWAAQHGAGQ